MRRYSIDDFAYYAMEFFDALGAPVIPDWNASLYFEFRDSANVLQFTATTTSVPALQAGATFVYVENLPLTGWAVGAVTVRVYGQTGGVDFEPTPLVATAFEVVDDSDLVALLRDLLHIDDGTQDAMLLTLIESAADYAEKYLARSLLTQDRRAQWKAPAGAGLSASSLKWPTLVLTYPPVQSITRVCRVDTDGDEDDLDADQHWVDGVSEPPELKLKTTYSYLLRAYYVAGYGGYGDLPDAIKRGILLHAAWLYKYRGDCDVLESAERSGAISAYRIYKCVRRG